MSACIPGTGSLRPDGYRQVTVNGRLVLEHRLAYELEVGPIPDGAVVDHACHNADPSCPGGPTCPHRECRNPEHLVAVDRGENVAIAAASRATCPAGHPWAVETTYRRPDGRRRCRPCDARRARDRRAAR